MKKNKIIIAAAALSAVACVSAAALAGCSSNSSGFDATKKITVIAREDGSGTKSAFMEIIGLKEQADVSGVVIQNGTAAVLQGVKSNPYAIAYDSLGYVTDEVKILKVDGVTPTSDTIKDGSYAISRPLNIVYKQATIDASPLYTAYYNFLMSKTAQDIVAEEGYVNTESTTTYTADASLSGTIAISGSTSLKPLMEVLAEKFEELQPNVTVSVGGGGSGTGLKDAENGTSAFGMISKEKKADDDAPSCVATAVARDGIAVIVNKENTLDNITLEQLKNIYDCNAGSNQVTVWNQIIK